MTDYSRIKSNRAASLVYSDEINDKLLKLMNDTGYSIEQVNGQRIFSSPRQDIIPPSRGCEVFVGKIPRDCYEDELFPILSRAGRVHELRLMMLFSGTNRGYAFVMYERAEDAMRAVDLLDGYEIRRGHRIGVLPCQNNCRLFIGCFGPGDRSPPELEQILRSETEGIVGVWKKSATATRGRWYLLAEYESHRAAAVARRHLTPRRDSLFGPRVIVDWEVPLERRSRVTRSSSLYSRRLQSPLGTPLGSPLSLDALPIMQTPLSVSSNKLRRIHSDISGQLSNAMDDMAIGRRSSNGLSTFSSPRSAVENCSLPFEWQQNGELNGGKNGMSSSLNWLSFRKCGVESSSPIDTMTMLRRRESADHGSAQQRRQCPPVQTPNQPTFRDGPLPTLQQLLLSPDSGLYSEPEVNQHPSSPGSSGSGSSITESPWSSADHQLRYRNNYSPPQSPPLRSAASRSRHLWDTSSSDYFSCSISELEGPCLNHKSLLSADSTPDRPSGPRYLLGNGDMHWFDNSPVDSPRRSPLTSPYVF